MGILLDAAATTTDATAAGGTFGMWGIVLIYVVLFGALYFFMMRPQRKEQKRVAAMLSELEKGDFVLTTSGFYGVVIDIPDETTVIVEFGNNKNCRIPMEKSAISRVEKTSEQK